MELFKRKSSSSEEMNLVVKCLKNFLVSDIYFSKVCKEIRLITGSSKHPVVILCMPQFAIFFFSKYKTVAVWLVDLDVFIKLWFNNYKSLLQISLAKTKQCQCMFYMHVRR